MTRSGLVSRFVLCASALAFSLAGCGSSGSDTSGSGGSGQTSSGGSPGSSGGVSGTGGSAAGTGGTTATGTGGRAGTGGSTQGTGGSKQGTGGSKQGTGGSSSGSGGTVNTGGTVGSGGVTGGKGGSSAGGGASGSGAGGRASGSGGSAGSSSGGTGVGGGTGAGGSGSMMSGMSAGCGKAPTLASNTYNNGKPINITAANMQRRYILHVPTNYDNTKPYKLVVAYHALNSNDHSVYTENYYGLLPLSNDTTIFVAPNGQQNGAPCSGTGTGDSGCGWPNPSDQDMQLADAVVKQVEDNFCVDTNRIFASGWRSTRMDWRDTRKLSCAGRPQNFLADSIRARVRFCCNR